jgi:hypothetical protein
MGKDILIKHKEATMICEESGLVIANYNTLLTQLETKPIAQPMVTYITTRPNRQLIQHVAKSIIPWKPITIRKGKYM